MSQGEHPFADATAMVMGAVILILVVELMVGLIMRILVRLGVYVPTAPLGRQVRRILLLTLLIGFFAGTIVVVTYGMWVSMFGGQPGGIQIN